jgi:hypothetical protein
MYSSVHVGHRLEFVFFHWLYSHLGPWPLIFHFHDHFTDGKTTWKSGKLVARPLPKHRTTQTKNKHMYISNIHALYCIRTHDPGFRASEDSTCLRPLGYRDRQSSRIDHNRHCLHVTYLHADIIKTIR